MKNKTKYHVKRLTASALFAALTCVSTLIVITYSPAGGYIHFGDCFVILSGFLLGPLWGGIAAGIGAALTDFILGYAVYVPATFVIKWAMAAAAALLFKLMMRKNLRCAILKRVLAAAVAGIVMVVGYFGYECILYGFEGAFPNIFMNLIQAAAGVIAASLLMIPLTKIGYIKRFFE